MDIVVNKEGHAARTEWENNTNAECNVHYIAVGYAPDGFSHVHIDSKVEEKAKLRCCSLFGPEVSDISIQGSYSRKIAH